MWNGSDSPPESMDGSGNNYKKVICSRNGVKVTLDDTDGPEQLILETPGGQKLTLKDGAGSVTIEDSNGNSIKLESAGITVTAVGEGDRQRIDGRDLRERCSRSTPACRSSAASCRATR